MFFFRRHIDSLAQRLDATERYAAVRMGFAVPEEPVGVSEEAKRVFHAYPQQRTFRMVVFAAILLFVVGINVATRAIAMSPASTPEEVARPRWHAPGELVEVYDFSDGDLTGVASGRMHELVFAMSDHIRTVMMARGAVCGTPWLDYASFGGAEPELPTSPQRLRNMLVMRSERDTFLNPRIIDAPGDKMLLAAVPFRYKHDRASRAVSRSVTISHSRGTYTSKNADEAFCLQELLVAADGSN